MRYLVRRGGAGASGGVPAEPSAQQPWDLLLICTAGYLLTAVMRVQAVFPPLAALRPALLFAALGFLAYLFAGQRGPRALRELRHPLGYLALFLFLWATLGAPLGLYPGRSVRFLFDELYKVGILFLLCAAGVRNLHDLRRLLLVYVAGAGIFAFFAAAPGFRAVGAGGYDANDSAMVLASAIPLCVYFLIGSQGLRGRLLYGAILALCMLAIAQTGSRGGFLALLGVAVYIMFFFRAFKPAWRLGAVGALAGILAVGAGADFWERMQTLTNPDDDYNMHEFSGRKQVWTRGVGYMLANPVFGVGIRNFSVAESQHPVVVERIMHGRGTQYKPAHSIWVDVGVELGIPGLLAFVGVFLVAIGSLRRRAPPSRFSSGEQRAATEDRIAMGQAIAGTLVALLVAGTFLSQSYGYAIWATLGLSLAFIKLSGPARRPERVPELGRRPTYRGAAVPRSAIGARRLSPR